ncbi:MAG: pinensin family lanthipeptide [Bacteroidota bacterium]
MKTKKLNLKSLQLKSFVMEFEPKNAEIVKGGTGARTLEDCLSYSPPNSVCSCPIH